MDFSLAAKRALVTGGTRGIGKAIVKRLIEEGAHVVFVGTNEELGRAVAAEFSSAVSGAKVHFLSADVTSTQRIEGLFKESAELLGGEIQILVNNAGITRDNLLLKLTEEEWDAVMLTNLKSLYNTCRAAIRPMMRARYGKIINITSIVGMIGNAGQTNYAASKAGVIGFTKSLAKEYASRNIYVNAIAPGFIETAMTDKIPEALKAKMLESIPLARFGRPEEIANAVLFLASALSDYMTGQTLTIDGGMVMGG